MRKWTGALLGIAASSQLVVPGSAADTTDPRDAAEPRVDGESDTTTTAKIAIPQPVLTAPYFPPDVKGLHWSEIFDDEDWMSRWIHAESEKFTGKFIRALRDPEALIGDFAMKVPDANKFFGISSRVPAFDNKDGNDVIVSYETKFESGLDCGGAYVKLFQAGKMDLKEFNDTTSYAIMFGPDYCFGATNKVHLIFRAKNPITGEITEHHLDQAPTVTFGNVTHSYTLRVLADDRYEIYVDGEVVKKGSLLDDFTPPFTPPEMIDDPDDKKPEDWVEDSMIPDPDQRKPDDWDEDAPQYIPDSAATIPEGWLEDEEPMIDDPEATKPEDWDVEASGEWIRPQKANPKCEVGCGPWSPPQIPNPLFKGKWERPLMANPDYKGPWAPKQIKNPKYFKSESPHRLLHPIDAIGFDLWTVSPNLVFDNIVMSDDIARVLKFVEETTMKRQKIEKLILDQKKNASEAEAKKSSSLIGSLTAYAKEKPIIAAAGGLLFLFSAVFIVTRAKSGLTATPPEAPKKKVSAKESDDSAAEGAGAADATETPKRARRRAGRPAAAD